MVYLWFYNFDLNLSRTTILGLGEGWGEIAIFWIVILFMQVWWRTIVYFIKSFYIYEISNDYKFNVKAGNDVTFPLCLNEANRWKFSRKCSKNALQEVFESRSHIKIDSREKSKNNQSSKIDSKRSKTREKETIREEKTIIWIHNWLQEAVEKERRGEKVFNMLND